MNFGWLFGRSSWPAGVPRLYPALNDQQLAQFLDLAEFQRIAQLPQLSILPLVSKDSRDEDVVFGLGLQKRLIRDLMLVRNLSVRGPEDTPEAYLESAPQLREAKERTIFVSGQAQLGHGSWRVELRLFAPGPQAPFAAVVHENDFSRFLEKLAETIAHVCHGQVTDQTRQLWRHGRPTTPQPLLALGEICASYRAARSQPLAGGAGPVAARSEPRPGAAPTRRRCARCPPALSARPGTRSVRCPALLSARLCVLGVARAAARRGAILPQGDRARAGARQGPHVRPARGPQRRQHDPAFRARLPPAAGQSVCDQQLHPQPAAARGRRRARSSPWPAKESTATRTTPATTSG